MGESVPEKPIDPSVDQRLWEQGVADEDWTLAQTYAGKLAVSTADERVIKPVFTVIPRGHGAAERCIDTPDGPYFDM